MNRKGRLFAVYLSRLYEACDRIERAGNQRRKESTIYGRKHKNQKRNEIISGL